MPPKSPLATIMATAAPTIKIHKGAVGGQTRAIITPVTQAERLLITIFCFVIFWNRYSKHTQDTTEIRILISAASPNTTIPIMTSGKRAIRTLPIIIVVLHLKLK
jgi:hypothetical protein